MLARVITLRFDPILSAFDDGPLRDSLKDKEVLSIRDHFFVKHKVPYLAVLVTYDLQRPEPAAPAVDARESRDASWRALVSAADIPLFNALCDWRAERSKQEGVPPYVICTNRQFAAMVQARPQSLAKLGAIEGIGKAKLEKYGQEILAMLTLPPRSPQPAAPSGEKDPEDAPSHG
jgi:superfamily II DNA helicase RecQ